MNHSPEILDDVAQSAEGNVGGMELAASKEKNRKMHRDWSSSRSHHKKSKEAAMGGSDSAKTETGGLL